MIVLDKYLVYNHTEKIRESAEEVMKNIAVQVDSPTATLPAAVRFGEEEKEIYELLVKYIELVYSDISSIKDIFGTFEETDIEIANKLRMKENPPAGGYGSGGGGGGFK